MNITRRLIGAATCLSPLVLAVVSFLTDHGSSHPLASAVIALAAALTAANFYLWTYPDLVDSRLSSSS